MALIARIGDLVVILAEGIFAEGNSYLAQLIITVLCNSDVNVWHLEKGTNDFFAYSLSNDAALLLLDNDVYWNLNQIKTSELLKRHFTPTTILLGSLNSKPEEPAPLPMREMFYRECFPQSVMVQYAGRWLPNTCRADFTHCRQESGGHTCIPGPINAFAENFVRQWERKPQRERGG